MNQKSSRKSSKHLSQEELAVMNLRPFKEYKASALKELN